jgi:hypothetical protein
MSHIFEPLVVECAKTERFRRPNIVVEYKTLDRGPTISVFVPQNPNSPSTATVRNIIGEIVLGRIDDVKGQIPATPDEQFANAAADAAARLQWLLQVHLPEQIVESREAPSIAFSCSPS